jgi:F-type H+-transporting ATPase subunit delta
MNESKITVRYAKALFSLAKEQNSLTAMKQDMELLYQCIGEIPELQYVIQSPVIKVSEKLRLFQETFKTSFSPLTLSFINLIVQGRREEHLRDISRYALHLLKIENGIQLAELVTATPLSEALRSSIVQFIEKKFHTRIEITESVDEKLIGGFILRVGDQQIDASISSKLAQIKQSLTSSHS